jgi:hypothetical protein
MIKNSLFLILGIVVFFLCPVSSADVPHLINYQGKLTTAEGGCVHDTLSLTFTIYSDSLGMFPEWSEPHMQVAVREGVFSVLLGSVNPIPDTVFDGDVKYLGVQVESDPETRPLRPIVSVAYAYRAAVADGGDITGVYADSGLTGGGTTGEVHLDVGAGDGIAVSADQVSVNVVDFAGNALIGWENDLHVSTGIGLQISGDAVQLNSSYSTGTVYDYRFVNENQPSSVTGDMIQDGTVQLDDIGQNDADSGQVVKWDGSSWSPGNDETITSGWLSAPAYNSGWVAHPPSHQVVLTHNLGGDPYDYFVDLQFKNNWSFLGIHNQSMGGDYRWSISQYERHGAYYFALGPTTITIDINPQEALIDSLRVRIWRVP